MAIHQKGDVNKIKYLITLIGLIGLTLPKLAVAYIGPGAGLSLIGSLIGVIVAVLMALGILLSWPVRILIRRIRGTPTTRLTEYQNHNDQPVNSVNSTDN